MTATPRHTQILDEAYLRLHHTGPEIEGWNTNHGPMAVESLAHHGHEDDIHRWIDEYQDVLVDAPRPGQLITANNWREALGDPRRLGDWPLFFHNELSEAGWTDVLARWWPRLLPGITAGATHGVIRVGHAVRTLREQGTNEARLAELAQSLGYWATRWQEVAGSARPSGDRHAEEALAGIPRVGDQTGGIRPRLAQLEALAGWQSAQAALQAPHSPDDAHDLLRDVVTAAVNRYHTHGHGSPVMLVHSATAPNAVLRVLPSLPRDQWITSAATAWTASAAVMAAYAPPQAADHEALPRVRTETTTEVFESAAHHGDAHVIKFADTALDVHGWTGTSTPLDAAARSLRLINDVR